MTSKCQPFSSARALLLSTCIITGALVTPIYALAQSNSEDATHDVVTPWVENAMSEIDRRKAIRPNKRRAKNVILFIADGMDPTTVTAARIYDGQTRGEEGEENFLSFETFPHLAMAKTYNTNAQTPDSAGTATAMVTGVKTKSGVISLTDAVEINNCASAANARISTIGELAERRGMSTGIVSTARLTHATPATVYAHAASRNWEADSDLTDEARESGCTDIARQLIGFPDGDGIDVAMGGGRRNFMPETVADTEQKNRTGARKDGRNLVREWASKSDNHLVVMDKAGFDAIDPSKDPRVLGLFEHSHMQYELDRIKGEPTEPSLAEMTKKSIEILSRNRKGYFLMVEAGRVDHAHHGGNAARALHDTQAFSQAVAVATEMTDDRDTLIIVTADHGHTLALQGYPVKGNDILGLVRSPYEFFNREDGLSMAADDKPYTTLTYANGPGSIAADGEKHRYGRPDLTLENITDPDYQQHAAIPLGSETHGGQDVTIYAQGPQAYLFSGVVEQSYIFHIMDKALGLTKKKKR